MNIMQVTSSISRSSGGVGLVVKNLAASLQKASCEVTLCCLYDKNTFSDLPEERNFIVIAELPSKFGLPGSSTILHQRFTKLIPQNNILHCHCLWEACLWSASNIACKNRKPYVVTPHGMLDSWAINNSKWKKKIAGWLFVNKYLKNSACIHALCESEYQSIRAYGLKNPIAVIPSGIDLPEINKEFSPPWQGLINKEKKVMLFIGRIHPKKGLENLIKAWSIVQPEGWILVISGWDQNGHEDQLKKLVKGSGLEKDVLFLGPVFDDKKRACLQNANAFILPSFSEGLPMSVLEAWSYSLPVLMTKECNLPEGFESNAAVEIQPKPDSIAEGMKQYFNLHESVRHQMGKNGLELVKNKFSWPNIASQMVNVYKWILGNGSKPDCINID